MTTGKPIFWGDVETTGLWPDEEHLLLEFAYIITDAELNPLSDGQYLIRQNATQARVLMNDFVRRMHEKSGIIETLGTGREVWAVEAEIIADIREVCGDVQPTFGGNSINLDRNFLHAFMPELNDQVLSYRNIDVSSLKELARRWAPDIADAATELKTGAHRALDDIRESIAELRFYRDRRFIGGGQ